jgi:hypothetical protein
MTRKYWIPLVAAFMAFTLSPAGTHGQNLAQIWELAPKAGHGPAFQEALRAHMEYRKAQGDPWDWRIYQVVVGDNVGTFYAWSGNHTWSDFDAYMASDIPQTLSTHYGATVGPLAEPSRTWIEQGDTTLVRLPDNMDDQTLFTISEFQIVPGHQMAFSEAMTKFHEAMEQADAPVYYAVNYPVAGGTGPAMTMVGFAENFAGMAEPDPTVEEIMMEVYGEEEATEIFQAFTSGLQSYKNMVLTLRTDLSMMEGM